MADPALSTGSPGQTEVASPSTAPVAPGTPSSPSGGGSSASPGAGSGGAGSAISSGSPQSVAAGSSTSSASGTAGAGGPATPSAPGTPDYATVRDTLANYGIDLRSQFTDDHALLQHMAGMYRQAQEQSQLAQMGQVYLQHADQFQQWRRQQEEQAKAQQAQQQSWWKAPEYDPSWETRLTRDPGTGEIKVVPGNDPGLVQKYMAWVDHQRGFLNKFAQDPIGSIKPGIEQVVRSMAQEIVQQQLGGYREQTSAQALVQQNSQWLHARDQQGNVQVDQRGRPVLSEYGRAYGGYVQHAQRLGIQTVQDQHDYAVGMVQRDFMARQFQQSNSSQTALAQGQAAKEQFLQQAGAGVHSPQTGQNLAAGVNGAPVSPTPPTNLRSLQDLMLKNLQAAGFQPGATLDLGR